MRHYSLIIIIAASLATFACGPKDKDKLGDDDLAGMAGVEDGSKASGGDPRCSSQATQDELRRQLFARAAEIRGANGDNYTRIAGFALLQLDGAAPLAVVSAKELLDCRGHATLRLPAGLKVAGGRTSLGGDIGYSIAPGTRGVVTLGQSESITIPLATLTQGQAGARSEPAPAPSPDPVESPAPDMPSNPAPPPLPPVSRNVPSNAPVAAPVEAPRATARPSFDCRRARTAGERSVCSDPGLAALDRDMAARYRNAVANGGPADRRLLVQTRDRFLGYRDRCGNDACIAEAYRGRMREIDDIAAGRWQGQR